MSAPSGSAPPAPLPRPRRKRRRVFSLLVLFLLVLIGFVAISGNPFAQGIREMAGWKHDQIILDKPFTVAPHLFRYYKFSLPEGSANVAIVGQFTAAAVGNSADSQDGDHSNDSGVEVFVLTDADFTAWQTGRATASIYDSGVVAAATVKADLPAGAGTYYLVFSNRSSPMIPKSLHATVVLRYNTWLRRLLPHHDSAANHS